MPFQRIQDEVNKKTSVTMQVFRGYHGGYGNTDQPQLYSWTCDLDYRYQKPQLRIGKKKNETTGYAKSIDGLIDLSLGGTLFAGKIHGGAMDILPITDIVEA